MPDAANGGRLTEIRIHGVGGTTPSALLDDPHPRQEWGDRVAGFYRTADVGRRRIEAYSWGGLTSRSWTRVFWLLLFPFMTANMAGWMAPRGPDGPRPTPVYVWLARLAALAATVNVVLINSLGALDVVGYQWGGGTGRSVDVWFNPFHWAVVADHPGRRVAVGVLWPALLIALFAFLSVRSRHHYEQVEPPLKLGESAAPPSRTAAAMPDGLRNQLFWNGYLAHTRLSRYHLAVSIALVAVLVARCAVAATGAGGGAVRAGWAADVITGLGGLILLATIVLLGVDRIGLQGVSRWLFWSGPALLMLAVALAIVQPPAATLATELPGMRDAFNRSWMVVVGLLIPLLGALAWTAWRRRRRQMPPARPAFACAPFVVNGFGLIVGNIVMLGVLIVVARILSTGDLRWEIPENPAVAPASGTAIYLFPTVGAAIALLTIGLLAVLLGVLGWQLILFVRAGLGQAMDKIGTEVAADYADEQQPSPRTARSVNAWWERAAPPDPYSGATASIDAQRWVRTIARWRFLATRAQVLPVLLNLMVFGALVATLTFGAMYLLSGNTPELPALFVRIGVAVGVVIPPAVLLLARWSWRSTDNRRIVGVLWDVGTFFPRSYHPFAPPSYTERAVPELLRRIWYLHDTGSRVVLAAHSQGSVIAAAALSRQSSRAAEEPPITLATFGSPLRKLYQWAFPCYFDDDLLTGLTGRTGIGPVRWRNFFYLTDYVGGPAGPARPADDPGGIDHALRDPSTCLYLFGQPAPRVGSHTGYWADPTFRRALQDFAPSPAEPDPANPGTGARGEGATGTASAGSSPAPDR